MKPLFFTLLAFFPFFSLFSQELAGHWQGQLTQQGVKGVFRYELNLSQSGASVSGSSRSVSPDGKTSARFLVTGLLENDRLVLQEVQQTEPAGAKWCLKYATLRLLRSAQGLRLEGDWKAGGCAPGRLVLDKTTAAPALLDTLEQELPFEMSGDWTGHLSQSDREYGFFFRLSLNQAPQGHSFIVSEDNGGSALHRLEWRYEEKAKTLSFREAAVVEKTDPRWPWCIKQGALKLRREGGRYILEGEWSGYIEGHDPQSAKARCAPGKVYLEKPVLTRQLVRRTEQQQQRYAAEQQRQIRVDRVLEVQSREIRLRVWDNGAVDGDFCTLFLNGERILHNYRVSKSKWAIPVTLKEESNFLILHAESLGNIPPNTVAVSVDDGVREQIIVLSSNLQESGAIMIREFRVE